MQCDRQWNINRHSAASEHDIIPDAPRGHLRLSSTLIVVVQIVGFISTVFIFIINLLIFIGYILRNIPEGSIVIGSVIDHWKIL